MYIGTYNTFIIASPELLYKVYIYTFGQGRIISQVIHLYMLAIYIVLKLYKILL